MTAYRRWLRPLLALVLLAPLLLACARATPEPITITFACLEEDAAYYQGLVLQFTQAHPSITVEFAPKGYGDLRRIDPAKVDVFLAPLYLSEWVKADSVLSLDPWLTQDKSLSPDDFYPGLVDLCKREGKTWALPAGMDLFIMCYNKDLFDRYGVPYPKAGWTWDDFLTTVLSLRDPQAGVWGYASNMAFLDAILCVYQHGGRIVDDWANPTRTTFDDPQTIAALEWYDRLIHTHNVAPTPEQATQEFGGGEGATYNGIRAGKVALWTDVYTSQSSASEQQRWPFKWGMTTLPRDQQAATIAQAEALAISAQTKHPEACWQWLAFLSQQPPARLVPARRSVAESAAYERLVGAENAAAARQSAEHTIVIPFDTPELYGKLGQLWMQAINDIVNGDATVQEAMTRAQQLAGD